MTDQFFTFVSDVALPLILSVFSLYVAPAITNFVNDKQLNQAVHVAVTGVEQYLSCSEGAVKKQVAKDYVLSKFELSDDQLNLLIESAVFRLNNSFDCD